MHGNVTVDRSLPTDLHFDELQEKFLRLLELDRDSEEFLRLFAEVDAQLDACVESVVQMNVA